MHRLTHIARMFFPAGLVAPALLALAAFGVGIGGSAAWAAPPSDAYQLVWRSEFHGEHLNRDKWRYRSLGPRKGGVNVKSAVQVDGEGHLKITVRKKGDKYLTGMIGTQRTMMFRYGYVEARVLFQEEGGHHSAFWSIPPRLGGPPANKPKKEGVEIDIIEYLAGTPNRLRINLHWGSYGGPHHESTGHTVKIPGLGEGWHTVGLKWTPHSYTFYVDGELVWRYTGRAISHRTQLLILSDEVTPWGPGEIESAELPDRFLVDYVRLYQRPGFKPSKLIIKHPAPSRQR